MDPRAQGQGVGRGLLARVEAEVRARGGRLLLIETSDLPAYASARRLYEGSGYRREAVVHDFYGPGDSLLIFSKHLDAPQLTHSVPAVEAYPQSAPLFALVEKPEKVTARTRD